MYFATSLKAVSLVLTQEEESGMQRPIYYTSRVLHDAKIRYFQAKNWSTTNHLGMMT